MTDDLMISSPDQTTLTAAAGAETFKLLPGGFAQSGNLLSYVIDRALDTRWINTDCRFYEVRIETLFENGQPALVVSYCFLPLLPLPRHPST